MKIIITSLLLIMFGDELSAQSVGIGTNTPNPKAALEVNSTSKGVLIPSMTSSQRIAITTPPNGLMVYDTDKNEFYHYNGTGWRAILNGDYWSRPITARDRVTNVNDSIGIGTTAPTAKFHVNGDVKITDGTQGDGKILTSDANGLASWQSAPLTSNDRIFVRYKGFKADSLMGTATIVYDNGPGINFNPTTNDFTILKSGLYHFEGTASDFPISSVTAFRFSAGVIINGFYYSLSDIAQQVNYNASYELVTLKYSIDIYLDLGSKLGFRYQSNGFSNISFGGGYVSGYLISQ